MLSKWGGLKPSLYLDFTGGAADSRLTTSGGAGGTIFNSAGTLTATSCPRYDYNPATLAARGLLIEEQRTNSIRNNTMVGGGAGVSPTNWTTQPPAAGVTRTIIGVGAESGISYIDIQFSGTPSATVGASLVIRFDGTTQIAAAQGQTWSSSMYCRIVGGDFTNISPLQFQVQELDGVGSSLALSPTSMLGVTTAALASQRLTQTYTLVNASTAFIANRIAMGVTSGQAVNVTLRIGLPQLELGAFVTSPIQTSTVAVTRTADSVSMTGGNFSSWYTAAAGTLYTEATPSSTSAAAILAMISDGSANNYLRTLVRAGGSFGAQINSGGVGQFDATPAGSFSAGSTVKGMLAATASDFATSFNGGAVTAVGVGSMPVSPNKITFGAAFDGSSALNGWVRGVKWYPTRLGNSQIQALTV